MMYAIKILQKEIKDHEADIKRLGEIDPEHGGE